MELGEHHDVPSVDAVRTVGPVVDREFPDATPSMVGGYRGRHLHAVTMVSRRARPHAHERGNRACAEFGMPRIFNNS